MFLNAMHGGLGPSLGAIVFGKMQSVFGTADTFVYLGIFDVCFVALVVMYLGLRHSRRRLELKTESSSLFISEKAKLQ